MPAWMDERGQIHREPWRTMDGLVYPITVVPKMPIVRWTDEILSPTAEVNWKMVCVYVGPEAPLPGSVARQWIFEQAAGMTIDQWQQIASAEAAKGVYLKDPDSVAQYIWDRVYAFRPYTFVFCGPAAPYPLPPTPQQILDGAAWFQLPRGDEDRERRIAASVAEWELGLYD